MYTYYFLYIPIEIFNMLINHTLSYINQEAIIALLLDILVVYIILNFF